MTSCKQILITGAKLWIAEQTKLLLTGIMPQTQQQKLTGKIRKFQKELPDSLKDIHKMLNYVAPKVKTVISEMLETKVPLIAVITLPHFIKDILSEPHHSIEDLKTDYLQYAKHPYKIILQRHSFIFSVLKSLLDSKFPEIVSTLEGNLSPGDLQADLQATLTYAIITYKKSKSKHCRKMIQLFLEALSQSNLIEITNQYYNIDPYRQMVQELLNRNIRPIPRIKPENLSPKEQKLLLSLKEAIKLIRDNYIKASSAKI